ncbi:seryl-tRNA synthetase [Arthrobacter sp. V1I9]|nr:seryl-tRNA synthetase [Arthrobacter sp. V1I9]
MVQQYPGGRCAGPVRRPAAVVPLRIGYPYGVIDVKDLSENPDKFRASQRARGADESVVDAIISADSARRAALIRFENLRAEQNVFGKKVAQAKGDEKKALLAEVKELANSVKAASAEADAAQLKQEELLRTIPNLIEDGVPEGGEDDYVVVKTVGTPREFPDFEPRDHLEIGELIGAIDMERGAKVSGARFYFLRGVGARLEMALLQMAMDQAIEAGFVPMITPTLVRPETMQGTGFDVKHDAEIYRLAEDDLYLVGTSEVALAGYHADEILDFSAGPIRYAGQSSCYRREAGSHGKDTRGIIRVHQFNKVEMFIYTTVEEAAAEHQRLLAWEEEMLAKCELPYRVIDTAAGDLGMSAARKYDCEAWVPTQGAYRELTSTSNCTTFQARRLNIRERAVNAEGVAKGTRAVATLNGTLATTRWIVALLEHHQNADGSVNVPKALQKYIGGLEVLPVL